MTRDEIVAVLNRREHGFKSRNPVLLAASYGEHAVLESPISGVSKGRDAIREANVQLFAMWSPLEHTREDLLSDANRAVIRFKIRATHAGKMFGLPATGKKFTLRSMTSMTFENDEIVHEQRVYDFTGLLMRVGVLKAKPWS